MSRAVHRLEPELLLLHFEPEHVLSVVIPVARGLPQLGVVDVGRDDLLEPTLPVLFAEELNELVVYVRALGLEEAGAGGELVEEEQVLGLVEKKEFIISIPN